MQVRSLGQKDPRRRKWLHQLQYSCLGNPMDRGAWWVTVHGVTESDTTEQLSTQQHDGKGKTSRLRLLKAQEEPCLCLTESPHNADSENRSRYRR